MASCGVAQLVSDTRFFTESTLGTFFESLVSATESGDGVMEPEPSIPSKINRSGSPGILLNENKAINLKLVEKKSKINTNEVENSLLLIMSSISDLQLKASSKDLVSASSVSWLENILIEASLRNRDRLCLFWNLLVQHYEMTIETAVLLTYPLERYVLVLFCSILEYFIFNPVQFAHLCFYM